MANFDKNIACAFTSGYNIVLCGQIIKIFCLRSSNSSSINELKNLFECQFFIIIVRDDTTSSFLVTEEHAYSQATKWIRLRKSPTELVRPHQSQPLTYCKVLILCGIEPENLKKYAQVWKSAWTTGATPGCVGWLNFENTMIKIVEINNNQTPKKQKEKNFRKLVASPFIA